MRGLSFQTLIGLLACTGLRIGEALRLQRKDIDWNTGLLTVRHSKFGRSRSVPLQVSTLSALQLYLRSCAAAFKWGKLDLWQICFVNGVNNDLPLTRSHLYA